MLTCTWMWITFKHCGEVKKCTYKIVRCVTSFLWSYRKSHAVEAKDIARDPLRKNELTFKGALGTFWSDRNVLCLGFGGSHWPEALNIYPSQHLKWERVPWQSTRTSMRTVMKHVVQHQVSQDRERAVLSSCLAFGWTEGVVRIEQSLKFSLLEWEMGWWLDPYSTMFSSSVTTLWPCKTKGREGK